MNLSSKKEITFPQAYEDVYQSTTCMSPTCDKADLHYHFNGGTLDHKYVSGIKLVMGYIKMMHK